MQNCHDSFFKKQKVAIRLRFHILRVKVEEIDSKVKVPVKTKK